VFRSRATDRFSIQRTPPQGGSACILMPPRYPYELRREVCAAFEAGESNSEIAARFAVSESWVRRLRKSEGIWHPPTAGDNEFGASLESLVQQSRVPSPESISDILQSSESVFQDVELYFAPHPARNTGEILSRFWREYTGLNLDLMAYAELMRSDLGVDAGDLTAQDIWNAITAQPTARWQRVGRSCGEGICCCPDDPLLAHDLLVSIGYSCLLAEASRRGHLHLIHSLDEVLMFVNRTLDLASNDFRCDWLLFVFEGQRPPN
jgi:hypothetical protein